jgi:hypothetical protein
MLSLSSRGGEVALTEQHMPSNLTDQLRKAAQQTNVEVRVGYFGMCARLTNASEWTCMSGSESLVRSFGADATDALGVLRLAERFKTDVVFSGMM